MELAALAGLDSVNKSADDGVVDGIKDFDGSNDGALNKPYSLAINQFFRIEEIAAVSSVPIYHRTFRLSSAKTCQFVYTFLLSGI